MRKIYTDEYHQQRNVYVGGRGRGRGRREPKSYGFFSFCFDCIMTLISGGLWLIWIFVREMRKS